MATTVGSGLTFGQGLRDGYPLYALVKRPEVPDRAPASYGAGMVTSGIAGTLIGTAPLASYWFFVSRQRAITNPVMKNVLLGAAAIWAFMHVPAGVAAGFQGGRIIATATGAASLPLPDRLPKAPPPR